ncbi:MAG: OmpA family protein [Pseudomonadota bacterium]
MFFSRAALVALTSSTLALAACTDPARLGAQPGDPNQRTKNGALIGATAGALLGALTSDDRSDGALVGAVVGGAVGAGIGYSLDRQAAELRQQLTEDVSILNTGDRLIVSMPNSLLFATDSSVVQPNLQSDLRALARNVQVYADSTLQVVGHTDSDGDAAYNQRLSEDRALAVGDILLSSGVPADRLQMFGRGESQPVASNLTEGGKAQNRRVEIVILPNAA